MCFCDMYCFEFDDCCSDFFEICPGTGQPASRQAMNRACLTFQLCVQQSLY